MSEQAMMTELKFEVNGQLRSCNPEGRTGLADFLRDELDLTGTHVGCEHGVCGACTVLLDGQPIRSCITLTRACENRSIQTIEGLDEDPVMMALQDAFMEFHGLQCGFCTPGMLIACRDIVLRNEAIDERELRIALGGNICRCTGYVGIVQAVQSVIAQRDQLLQGLENTAKLTHPAPVARTGALPVFKRTQGHLEQAPINASQGDEDGQFIHEKIVIHKPLDEVWAFLRDVESVVPCVPGARLIGVEGEQLDMEMEISLGAIKVRFRGLGRFSFDDAAHSGRFEGEGKDTRSGSGATGIMDFKVVPGDNENHCVIELKASYALTGSLSQFSRGGLIKNFVGVVARLFGENIQRALSGEAVQGMKGAQLNAFSLLISAVRTWLSDLFRKS
jgi:carbon-monoxide dehydrogenase small subunit